MIRFRLAELIADAQFKSGRRITLLEISEATGINRMTLSRMTNVRGYSTSTDTLDKLCKYFGCDIADVAGFIDDSAIETGKGGVKKSVGAPSATKRIAAGSRPSGSTRNT